MLLFQLRQIPVLPTEEGELEEEAEWIYKQAFATPPLSNQVMTGITKTIDKAAETRGKMYKSALAGDTP